MFTGADDLAVLDATAQADLVRAGEATAVELVEAAIDRIDALNPALKAVISTTYDEALARAATRPTGRFAGVPYLLKDLVVERAGLIILGRTNTPEFVMVPACEPLLYGPTRNPWSTDHSTSGSSGGSAAAVASGMVPMAHGNDVGGSIRYPASAWGLFGLKPTRARVPLGPLYGDVVNGMAAEHALTRTVRDSALLLDLTEGPGIGDPYPVDQRRRLPRTAAGRSDRRLRRGGRQPHRQPGDVGPDDPDRRGSPDGNPCPRPVR
ncbi:MAG TPA: amidase [Propionibacteriaceae bacterium]|nr:amidase [Propionibacteriaceae bacterium]